MTEDRTISLDIDAIRDYQMCARLYDYRHAQKMYESLERDDLLYQRYSNAIRGTMAFWFFKRQAGLVTSYDALIKRWEKLWFPKEKDAYDVIFQQHESRVNEATLNSNATRVLLNFHTEFSKNHLDPIGIEEKFIFRLGRKASFSGKFDVILRDAKTKEVNVIQWMTKPKRPSMGSIVTEFASIKYGFEEKHKEKNPIVTKYFFYDLFTNTQELVQVNVDKSDIEAFLFWAKDIRDSKIYPSRRGLTPYCKACPFDGPCSKWKIKADDGDVTYG